MVWKGQSPADAPSRSPKSTPRVTCRWAPRKYRTSRAAAAIPSAMPKKKGRTPEMAAKIADGSHGRDPRVTASRSAAFRNGRYMPINSSRVLPLIPGSTMAKAATAPAPKKAGPDAASADASGPPRLTSTIGSTTASAPATDPAAKARPGDDAIRQSSGAPPRVRPRKSAKNRTGQAVKASRAAPATPKTASRADPTVTRRRVTEARRSRPEVISATAPTSSGYTPAARIIVPALTPGTRLARPPRIPATAHRQTGTRPPVVGAAGFSMRRVYGLAACSPRRSGSAMIPAPVAGTRQSRSCFE